MRTRVIEELANAAGNAVSMAANLREEIKHLVRQRVEEVVAKMDLVRREEFEVVRDMAEKARLQQELLQKELDALKGKEPNKKAAKTTKKLAKKTAKGAVKSKAKKPTKK